LQPSGQATTVPVQQNVGPVHLASVGFLFENGAVSVLLDITFTAGGLVLELVGLQASIDISTRHFSVSLEGLSVAYQAGTVSIMGALARDTSSGTTDWFGLIEGSSGKAFSLDVAAAFSDDFHPASFFAFGYLKRTLGGPPSMQITGLAAGFGINREFIAPDVSQVNSFPFVEIASGNTGTQTGTPTSSVQLQPLLQSVDQYLSTSDGSDFISIGLTASSFGIVNSVALATIVFGTSVEFVLLGSSTIDWPPKAVVAHASLEIVATINSELLAIDGQLATGSYILSNACQLTGGFAFHIWFTGIHAGDFVFTLGGYNPIYTPPSHYPAVPRLAFTWQESSELLISGWAYFALTPGSLQLGGGLDVALSADPLSAWMHLQADFLVEWLPTFYSAEISLDVGVSFRLDLLFCSVTLTADIGADLSIWGPAFSGHGEFHLSFVSFGIDFGAGAPKTPSAGDWPTLLNSINAGASGSSSDSPALQSVRSVQLAAADDPAPTPTPDGTLQIGSVSGLTASSTPGIDWIADPETTVLSIGTTLPATSVTLNTSTVTVPGGPLSIYGNALDSQNPPLLDPVLAITVTVSEDGSPAGNTGLLGATAVVGQVPGTLWGNSSSGALVNGITSVTLAGAVQAFDTTPPVAVATLLHEQDQKKVQVAWSAPVFPSGSFQWSTDNPFLTIANQPAAGQRSAILGSLANLGYTVAGLPSANPVDVTFVTATQPCFLDDPILCQLGSQSA
jgi:hypothetical protein